MYIWLGPVPRGVWSIGDADLVIESEPGSFVLRAEWADIDKVAHDEVDARIAAALAAGGRLVSDARAPAFWVLADPEGNEACICTWQNRG